MCKFKLLIFGGLSMKNFLLLAVLMSSFAAQAELVITEYKGKLRYHKINGKVKMFPPIRVTVTHDDRASLINGAAAKDCKIEIGKNDILSLGTETNSYDCIGSRNNILISREAIQDMYDRSAIFTLNNHFERIDGMFDGGTLTNNTVGSSTTTNTLANLFNNYAETEILALRGMTHYTLTDANRREKITLQLTAVAVEYPSAY
jgi:hypothetical protein